MEFNKDTVYSYYVKDWHSAQSIRVDDSPKHKAFYEWCENNCKGRFDWTFVYSHNRPEHEPQVDAVTWNFELQQDADGFKQMMAPGR